MSVLRVVVVEDQAPAREHLVSLLAAHSDVEIVGVCADGESALRTIPGSHADVVLLDVQMPECSGFDVIRRVGAHRMPPVIFITAYESHAVRAFEVRALDYIVKPFSPARVNQALEVARGSARQRRVLAAAGELAASLAVPERPARKDRLPLRRRGTTTFVATGDVEYVRASRNDVVLHARHAEYRYRATLAEIQERLGQGFVQVHRSYLVNFDLVRPVLLVGRGLARVQLVSG
ncbi:MAG TPA: LytTR family DNA-binding domain-containing protein, partial [Vicinamibacterales bacterium]|nr:LytTR family DNA-binding domain-containing protein [Vicinamibacterales bacterium]